MKKKIMAAVIAGASLLSVMGGISAAPQFSDVNGHWGKDQIEFALAEGYVDGYPDGTFRPEQNVTRAEFMKLVIDALKFKKQDEPGKDWYAPYVTSAVANGIHLADEFSADHMNDPITREEMARIAVRATGEANYDVKKWMYLATSKGIINGMDDAGTLGPEQPTTRAQAITVIRRIMKIREGASLPKDKYAISAAEVYWHKTNVITMLPRYFSRVVKGERFRDELLEQTGQNVSCSVEKYVVVDMDDPNDPNRSLVPDDLQWMDTDGEYHDIAGNNYILVSKQTTYIKSYPQDAYYVTSCRVAFMERLYDDTGILKANGFAYDSAPLGTYTLNNKGKKTQKYSNRIVGKPGEEIIEVKTSFEILPKGKLISPLVQSDVFRIGFYENDVPSPKLIYDGRINEAYNGD
ncbi:hypothetical protein GCM10023310_19610 [Paenibacillus vulneris]|uniref:S-layer homology domain-containing protein n=1 Tax=Paenibacillus vulneris TaxID=1133364 RepID=A0ABW3UQZ6_9BACL